MANACFYCKDEFERIDLWPDSKNSGKFICRDCQTDRRSKKQKSFESDFREFRTRSDYVPQEETFQTGPSRVSDEEFDEIIREFEQAHWTEISEKESQTHQRYIESLLKREFWQRVQSKDKKNYQKIGQGFPEPDIEIHYELLGVSPDSTDVQVKEAYRCLILKWHPDKNPSEPKYAEKILISVRIAFEKIMKSRK